jgi:hypothetical protein
VLTFRCVQRTRKANFGLGRLISIQRNQHFPLEPYDFGGEPPLVCLLDLGVRLRKKMQSSPAIARFEIDLSLKGQEVGCHVLRPGRSPILRTAPEFRPAGLQLASVRQNPASQDPSARLPEPEAGFASNPVEFLTPLLHSASVTKDLADNGAEEEREREAVAVRGPTRLRDSVIIYRKRSLQVA